VRSSVDCILGRVRVMRHLYEVDGWGLGEVWERDGVILHHELAAPAPEPAAGLALAAAGPGLEHAAAAGPGLEHAAAAGPALAGAGLALEHAALDSALSAPGPRLPGPRLPRGDARPPDETLPGELQQDSSGFVPELCRRFARHLAGYPVEYGDVPVDLTWATPFQQALVVAARAVPWGDVVSYGELAALAGRPRAARAAGTFCAENRFSLIVPCHRVVASNGIGGYGPSGVSLKRRLLRLEGVLL
jgi:methylated-DNA-[protein]-cysteine S-methyltransferase